MAAGAWSAGIKDFIVSVLRFVFSPLTFIYQQRQALGRYLLFALRVVIFPLAFVWAMGVARRHEDADPRARIKVGAAAVVGLLLAAGVVVYWYGYEEDARANMYEEASKRIAVAVGENAYQAQMDAVTAAEGQLEILNANLALAEEQGDEENATAFRISIDEVEGNLAEAEANVAELADNHAFYLRLEPVVHAQDDAAVKAMIADADIETAEDFDTGIWDPERLERGSDYAFSVKDKAEDDMEAVMVWLLFPMAIGVLFGPLFIALGNVLANDFEGSETVGYKKYPGASLGLFLILGGFGWPSILFSAWGLWDIHERETTGQIAL